MIRGQLFFIAIIPPEPIKSEVQKLKEDFAKTYGAKHALKSPPHITLIPPFKIGAQSEPAVNEFLKEKALETSYFKMGIKDYSCFKPRVIFLNPLLCRELVLMQNRLENAFYARFPFGSLSPRPYHPHLTIAFRDLTAKMFYEAWPRYKGQAYEAEFLVDRLWLLRHNGQIWEAYKEFVFKNVNLPV
jgi:2'-5' RNA ligase